MPRTRFLRLRSSLNLERLEARDVPGFLGPARYVVDGTPRDVAVGDFNGDGHRDAAAVVFINASKFDVAVLLGDGTGALGSAAYYETGKNAYSIRAADLNQDGKMDLVTGEVQYVSVFLGNGDGTFKPQTKFSTGATASIQVEVGEVNGDGKPDLVTSQNDANDNGKMDSASLLLGNGDGTFQPATIYEVGDGGANDVALGDLDGDGKDEITVGAYWGHELHVFYSTNGSHVVYALERTWGHTLADLNNDGHLDVVSGGLTFSVAIMLNNGDGTLQPAKYTQAADGYTFYPRTADFNRDGKADLAMANSSYPTVSSLLGNGDGSFKPFQSYPYGAKGNYLAPGDLNNDNYADLVVGGDTGVVVMLNDKKWAPGSGHRPPVSGPPFSDTHRDPIVPLPPAPPGPTHSARPCSVQRNDEGPAHRPDQHLAADAGYISTARLTADGMLEYLNDSLLSTGLTNAI